MITLHSNPAADRLKQGRVCVTLRSVLTGQHITLRLRCKNKRLKKRYITLAEAGIIGGEVPGRNGNMPDWVGYIKVYGDDHRVVPSCNADSARLWAMQKFWHYLTTGDLHPQLEMYFEDECARCGRPLNDPVSIERGIGPECLGRITGSRHQRRAHPKDEQLAISH